MVLPYITVADPSDLIYGGGHSSDSHIANRRYPHRTPEEEESEVLDGILDGAIEAPNSSEGVGGSVVGDQVQAGNSDSAGTTGSGVDTMAPSGITGEADYSFVEFLEGLLASVGAENETNRKYNTAEAIAGREWSAWEAQKNRDWQEYMSNTAYQRSVQDMRNAGLSDEEIDTMLVEMGVKNPTPLTVVTNEHQTNGLL